MSMCIIQYVKPTMQHTAALRVHTFSKDKDWVQILEIQVQRLRVPQPNFQIINNFAPSHVHRSIKKNMPNIYW